LNALSILTMSLHALPQKLFIKRRIVTYVRAQLPEVRS
jgi:hypothetical protein